jgi:hypothetical protein
MLMGSGKRGTEATLVLVFGFVGVWKPRHIVFCLGPCLVGPNWGGQITVDYCIILFLFGKNCLNID